MKRILSLLLAMVMLFSLAACSSSLETEETGKETAPEEETKTEEKTEEVKEKDTSPIVYPETFSVGFGRKVVNPPIGTGLGGCR